MLKRVLANVAKGATRRIGTASASAYGTGLAAGVISPQQIEAAMTVVSLLAVDWLVGVVMRRIGADQ